MTRTITNPTTNSDIQSSVIRNELQTLEDEIGVLQSYSGIIILIAGENLTANNAVYIKASDGKAYKTDATDTTKIDFVGFAQSTVTTGNSVTITVGETFTLSGLTANSLYYLSGTPGAITVTAPANVKIVGKALSTTILEIQKLLTIRTNTFTGSGTWTKLPGLKYIEVEVQAGGGGSGGSPATGILAASGAGGGGYSRKKIHTSALGATETVTVGAAGAAGSTSTDGGDGGDSSFGAHATTTGGIKGVLGTAVETVGGNGGTAASGDLNISGQKGTSGGGGTVFATGGPVSGKGGDSMLGIGGPSRIYNDYAGSVGSGYGAGAGGSTRGGGAATAGGAGTIGIVIVHEYY